MMPYEAFKCHCGIEDVVLRESYKPKSRGKLYYACPQSKKEERVRLLVDSLGASSTPSYSTRPSTPPSYSPRPSTPQSHPSGTSAGCLNCKHLLGKIKVFEATLEMYMHLEQHTRNSTALLHEVYNDMGNLGLE
ncbi:hypothetical protein Tco_0681134 [Tanacetum coccineum]|uniref:Zinc finger GRF-type domain-containing protein n=1 Tax=Tanacetum coccineum TaxID=301880 RepID=A0ABQ4XMQ0_9ASTR